jgi:hypothetical protein
MRAFGYEPFVYKAEGIKATIGKLSLRDYQIEVHVLQNILAFDEKGSLTCTQVLTLKEEVWRARSVEEESAPHLVTSSFKPNLLDYSYAVEKESCSN